MKIQRNTSMLLLHSMRFFFLVMLLFSAIGNIVSCSNQQENLEKRLGNFLQILTAEEQENFKRGQLDSVSKSLDMRIEQDETLKQQLKTLQHQEAIDLFSSKQTIQFFFSYFYAKTTS